MQNQESHTRIDPKATLAPLRRVARSACELAVDAGLPPALVGYRHCKTTTAARHVEEVRSKGEAAGFEVIHPAARADNPLPFNVGSLQDLPDDAGWWGYSMRDVPSRPKGETFIATIPDATVVTCIDGEGEFYPAILTKDGKSLEMREIRFRNLHAEHMRSSPPVRRLAQATWVCERVYDNHSHWLSAHLPKLSLLTREGRSASILLPEKLTGTMQASLEMLGLDPADHQRFRPGEVLKVGTLTVVGTDRFRGELLRPVRERMTASAQGRGKGRRIYISRRKAKVRRLVNEDEVWPLFEAAGFQRYDMEDVSFVSQVEMMAEAEALAAPHGAGLTNMIFCPSGTHVFEMAWLGFPNPNFYALACAMGHRYGIVGTRPVGGGPENFRDMEVDADAVRHGLAEMCRSMDAA